MVTRHEYLMMSGRGEEIKQGSRVLLDYVFRRADGYFVESTENKEPFTFKIGANEAIKGLEEGILPSFHLNLVAGKDRLSAAQGGFLILRIKLMQGLLA